jgi:hypothetical protein
MRHESTAKPTFLQHNFMRKVSRELQTSWRRECIKRLESTIPCSLLIGYCTTCLPAKAHDGEYNTPSINISEIFEKLKR